MNTLKIGVDNGNYNTKSSERMQYASGFAVSDREFITSDMQLFYEGAYYAIGGKRMNFQQEKTREDDAFILTLPAIANAMKAAGTMYADVLLGVGFHRYLWVTEGSVPPILSGDDLFFRFEKWITIAG
jgi:plasmid segregation protein ParM